jgi:hypothetical protein
VAASVSFGIYFAIAGAVFLDDYKVPQYKYQDWHLPVAVNRRNGRGHRPPGHTRRATGPGVHLPARRGPGGARARAVLDGADGRVPDPGGALQTAPILIAVVTAFLAMEGVKYLMASRKQARAAAAKPAAQAGE